MEQAGWGCRGWGSAQQSRCDVAIKLCISCIHIHIPAIEAYY
jgi:hypothetical protein